MNSAHASLLQWLQEKPKPQTLRTHPPSKEYPIWVVNTDSKNGFGPSYEAACYDLLQQLKK